MCHDIDEYNPFEPLYILDYGYYDIYLEDSPMDDYAWQLWLENDGWEIIDEH